MRLSAFATTFRRDTVDGVFAASASYGLTSTQFDFAAAGLETLPTEVPPETISAIRAAADAHGVIIDALEGTFNMAHPDAQHRNDGLRRFEVLAKACAELRIPVLTLCTGSRDVTNMWRRHPDNTSPLAWTEMRSTVAQAVQYAESHGVTLGVEPEINNVVDSPSAARRLLDELRSDRLKIIYDAANLYDVADPSRSLERGERVLHEAADLLGPDIVLAHAKDITTDGRFVAAGRGALPWQAFLSTLAGAGYTGAVVMHSLSEDEVPASAAMIRDIIGTL